MAFAYGFYIAAVVGAFGIYLMMPKHEEGPRWMGGLFSLATLGGVLLFLLGMVPPESRPTAYYYVFTLLAGASAALVVTHPRPVYAALYFILVVLSATGLLVLLEAEFMAFAMVLIYAGAILVTYLFVIMLATSPQTEEQGETAPLYDRVARHPIQAVAVGFFLLAVVSGALFTSDGTATATKLDRSDRSLPRWEGTTIRTTADQVEKRDLTKGQKVRVGGRTATIRSIRRFTGQWNGEQVEQARLHTYAAESYIRAAVLHIPDVALLRKSDDAGRVLRERTEQVAKALHEQGLIDAKASAVDSVEVVSGDPPELHVTLADHSERVVPLNEDHLGRLAASQRLHAVLREEIGNINRVGLNLFRSHTLGIELAGVLLLLAMVGAIVIARKHAAESPGERSHGAGEMTSGSAGGDR